MEYTIESINKPAPKPEPVQQPVPQIPSQPVTAPVVPQEPKIEIIVGDKIEQPSNSVQVVTPQPQTTGGRGGSMTELPMIPSMPIVDLPSIPSGGN